MSGGAICERDIKFSSLWGFSQKAPWGGTREGREAEKEKIEKEKKN